MLKLLPPALLLLLAASCATPPPSSAEELGIKNLAITEDRKLLTAGQLTEEQFRLLPTLGFDVLINVRPAAEDGTGWEEDFAEAHRIRFIRIPMDGNKGLTMENVQRLDAVMKSAENGVALYCSSSNRVGGLLALRAHFVDGMPVDAALKFGKDCGMTRSEPATTKILENGF